MGNNYYVYNLMAHSGDMDKPDMSDEEKYKNGSGLDYYSPDSDDANLVTSIVAAHSYSPYSKVGKGTNGVAYQVHSVVVDIDFPCTVVPSSEPGHYHLFINKEIPWCDYVNILEAFVKAGIVEEGYFNAAMKVGHTSVRVPGKHVKPVGSETHITRVKDHALAVWERFKYEAALREIAESMGFFGIMKTALSSFTKTMLADCIDDEENKAVDELTANQLSFQDMDDNLAVLNPGFWDEDSNF